MKESWERPEPPVLLDLKVINYILGTVFPGKRVIAADRIGTGLHNSNYRILLEGNTDPLVLRIYSESGEVAEKELAIAELVGGTIPIADILYADTSGSKFNRPWALLEWKQGSLLRDVIKTGSPENIASAAQSTGRILAGIHGFTFTEPGFFGKDMRITKPISPGAEHFFSFMEHSLFHNLSGKWLGAELAGELWSFCQRYGHTLTESRLDPVLVHSDFNGPNILMQQEPAGYSVSAVLDWEFAFSASRYIDIANMLRYEQDGSLFEQHFIAAYRESGGVLEDNWKRLSKLEDLVALCDMLNHSTKETPNRLRDLQRLVAGTVRSFS
jgi:aminoglycoside phosphotransferase (APT) family kinase protein